MTHVIQFLIKFWQKLRENLRTNKNPVSLDRGFDSTSHMGYLRLCLAIIEKYFSFVKI